MVVLAGLVLKRPGPRRPPGPYAHWSEPRIQIRGRTKVFARLAAAPRPLPPDTYELRDGQIYRWTSTGPAADA